MIENKGLLLRGFKVCKTFIRRFDSDPRLQLFPLISNNIRNGKPRSAEMQGYAGMASGDTETGQGPDRVFGGAA